MGEIEEIAYKLLIVLGILVYVFGLIGNILNIFVFTAWCRPSRKVHAHLHNPINHDGTSNSPLYLLVSACANFIIIIYPVLTRIEYDGFRRPKTPGNELVTCKLRFYVLHTGDLISLSCICLATLDRYLISSRQARLRQLSLSRRKTQLLILFLILFIGIHNIPIAIYYRASIYGDCEISSNIYLYYYLFVIQIFLHGVLPISFISIFGILTYTQLKHIHHQTGNHRNFSGDKQLSRMLLLLCIAILISSVPYCAQNLYAVITQDFTTKIASFVLLFYYIAAILFFTNSTLSFYIFFLSTPNFRKQLKKIFGCKTTNQHLINSHGHHPGTTPNHPS